MATDRIEEVLKLKRKRSVTASGDSQELFKETEHDPDVSLLIRLTCMQGINSHFGEQRSGLAMLSHVCHQRDVQQSQDNYEPIMFIYTVYPHPSEYIQDCLKSRPGALSPLRS